MLLAIDIGNSLMKFGVFDHGELCDRFSIPTHPDYESDELLFDRLKKIGERFIRIDRVVVSTVVPDVLEPLANACRELLKVTPVLIDNSAAHGLTITYDPPDAIGADRLVNAYAAVQKYSAPVIVCSLGTATTVDAVNADSHFLGGMIAPGLATMAEALSLKTSRLPHVKIEKPETPIGNTTEDSIRSGLFYGYVGMVEGMVRSTREHAFARRTKKPVRVIATGGWSRAVTAESRCFDVVDDNLTLEGLSMLGEKL